MTLDILTTDAMDDTVGHLRPEHMNMTFDLELSPNFTHAQQTGDLNTSLYRSRFCKSYKSQDVINVNPFKINKFIGNFTLSPEIDTS